MTPSMPVLDRLLGFGPFWGSLGFRVAGPWLWEGPFRSGLTPGSLGALLRLTIFLGKLGGPRKGNTRSLDYSSYVVAVPFEASCEPGVFLPQCCSVSLGVACGRQST